MCVTFLYLNADAVGDANKYQLIVLNNRDEDFDRPTSLAAWQEGILAGSCSCISLSDVDMPKSICNLC
ncbi:unnamed protein product [Toxocara canis]|uniref:Secreted protein n=1 Tax=Toxocara canis TaxID=6265 RepID=A0A183U5Y1_TOXCA|nr:unnamed protein product [Toxocara canis]